MVITSRDPPDRRRRGAAHAPRRSAVARARNAPLALIHTPDEFIASEQSRACGTFAAPAAARRRASRGRAVPASRTPVLPAPPQPCDRRRGLAPPAPRATRRPPPARLAGTRGRDVGYAVVAPELGTLLGAGADVIRIGRAPARPTGQITIEPTRRTERSAQRRPAGHQRLLRSPPPARPRPRARPLRQRAIVRRTTAAARCTITASTTV